MYYDYNTKNKSFLDMHKYLKKRGIKNNNFFLAIKNKDLIGVDPHSSDLTISQKRQILTECMDNYWYFIREVVIIPEQDRIDRSDVQYKLQRDNLAFNFCAENNINIIYESPIHTLKHCSILIRILWEYNFKNMNSTTKLFSSGGLNNSRSTLRKIKYIKSYLPKYLDFSEAINRDLIMHYFNNNRIIAKPFAKNENKAIAIAREPGCSRIFFNNWNFFQYNKIIYNKLIPVFDIFNNITENIGNYHGIIITNTPSILKTDEAIFAHQMEQDAVLFSETFYDMNLSDIRNNIINTSINKFVLILYNYRELGLDEEWLRRYSNILLNNEELIKREIFLKWG